MGRAFDKVFPTPELRLLPLISSIDDLTKDGPNERVAVAVESVFTTLFNVVKALLVLFYLGRGLYRTRLIPDGIISNAVILLGVVADLVNMSLWTCLA